MDCAGRLKRGEAVKRAQGTTLYPTLIFIGRETRFRFYTHNHTSLASEGWDQIKEVGRSLVHDE
jgi:hypothetical protein